MTVLSNNQKSIKLSFTNKISISYDKDYNKECYNVNLPAVSCTNLQDAERIQQEVNEFVNKFSRDLLR